MTKEQIYNANARAVAGYQAIKTFIQTALDKEDYTYKFDEANNEITLLRKEYGSVLMKEVIVLAEALGFPVAISSEMIEVKRDGYSYHDSRPTVRILAHLIPSDQADAEDESAE